jgi:hypothetical protein
MRTAALAILFIALSIGSAHTETLTVNRPTVICDRLASAKIVTEMAFTRRVVEQIRGCWRIAPGTKVIILNTENYYLQVAVDNGTWSRAWVHLAWFML